MQENGCHTDTMQENFTGEYRQYAGKLYCLYKKIAQSPSLARQRNFCKIGTQFRNTRMKTLKMLKQSGKRRKIVFLNLQLAEQGFKHPHPKA